MVYIADEMKAAGFSIVFVVSLALAASVFKDYPPKQAKECAVWTENGSVTAGLDPIETLKLQKEYFGTDLSRKGFLPVFVVIENSNSSRSMIFDKTKVRLDDSTSSLATAETGMGLGKAFAWSTVPFLGTFAAGHVVSEASQIQTNLIKKELQSTTLSPGFTVRGFLYLPIPAKGARNNTALRLPVRDARTDEIINLYLTF